MVLALLALRANPFDAKAVLLAKHAQHVVLIHFPIALFITAIAFDITAHCTNRHALADAAYCNLLIATISTLPVVGTGILAWQFQLEGQKLESILLLQLVLACAASGMIWLTYWVHFHSRRCGASLPSYRFAIEASSRWSGHADGTFGRVSKRRKRTGLEDGTDRAIWDTQRGPKISGLVGNKS
jgi:uncharacterized membrane protein